MVYTEDEAVSPPPGAGGQGGTEENSSTMTRHGGQGHVQRLSLQTFLAGSAEIGGMEPQGTDRGGIRSRGPNSLIRRGRLQRRPRKDDDDDDDEDEQEEDEEEEEEEEEDTAESSTESEGEANMQGDSSSEEVEGSRHGPGQDVAENGDDEVSVSGAGTGDWEAALRPDAQQEPKSETKRKRGRPLGGGVPRRRPRSAASTAPAAPTGPAGASEVTVFTSKAAAMKEGPPGLGRHFHLVELRDGHVAWVQRPLGRREERVWRRHLVAASSVVVLEELGRLTLAGPSTARTGEEIDVSGPGSPSSAASSSSKGGRHSSGADRSRWGSTCAVQVESGLDREALARLLAEKDSDLQAQAADDSHQTKAVTERVASELPESEVFQGQTSKGVSKVVVDPEVAPFAMTAMDETSLYLEPPPPKRVYHPPPPPPPGLAASSSATSNSSWRNRRGNSRASMDRGASGGSTTPTNAGHAPSTPGARSQSPLFPGAPAPPSQVVYNHPSSHARAQFSYGFCPSPSSSLPMHPGSVGHPTSALGGMAGLPPPQPPLDASSLPPRVPQYQSHDEIQRLVHPHPHPPAQRTSPASTMFNRQPPPTAPMSTARPSTPVQQPKMLHQMLMAALLSLTGPLGARPVALPVGAEALGLSSDPSGLMDQLVARLALPAYVQQQALLEHRERLENYLAQSEPQFLPIFHSLGGYEKFKWLVFIDHITQLTRGGKALADPPRRQMVDMPASQPVEAPKDRRPSGAAPQADTEAMQSMVDSFSRSYKGKLYENQDGELFEVVSVFYDLAYEGWPFAVVRNKHTRKLSCPTPPLSLPNYLEPLLVEYFKKTHPDDPLVQQLRNKPQAHSLAPPTASVAPTARPLPCASAQPPLRSGPASHTAAEAPGASIRHALLAPPSAPPPSAPPVAPVQPLNLPRVMGVDPSQLHHRVCGLTLQDLQDDFLLLTHYHRQQQPRAGGVGMWHPGMPGLSSALTRAAKQIGRKVSEPELVWRVMEARPDWAKVVKEAANRLWGTQQAGGGARPEQQPRARRPPKELSWHIDTLDTPPTIA